MTTFGAFMAMLNLSEPGGGEVICDNDSAISNVRHLNGAINVLRGVLNSKISDQTPSIKNISQIELSVNSAINGIVDRYCKLPYFSILLSGHPVDLVIEYQHALLDIYLKILNINSYKNSHCDDEISQSQLEVVERVAGICLDCLYSSWLRMIEPKSIAWESLLLAFDVARKDNAGRGAKIFQAVTRAILLALADPYSYAPQHAKQIYKIIIKESHLFFLSFHRKPKSICFDLLTGTKKADGLGVKHSPYSTIWLVFKSNMSFDEFKIYLQTKYVDRYEIDRCTTEKIVTSLAKKWCAGDVDVNDAKLRISKPCFINVGLASIINSATNITEHKQNSIYASSYNNALVLEFSKGRFIVEFQYSEYRLFLPGIVIELLVPSSPGSYIGVLLWIKRNASSSVQAGVQIISNDYYITSVTRAGDTSATRETNRTSAIAFAAKATESGLSELTIICSADILINTESEFFRFPKNSKYYRIKNVVDVGLDHQILRLANNL